MITTYNGITLYLFAVNEHSTEHTILKSRNCISLSYNDLYRGDKMKVSENIIRLKDGFTSAEIIGQTKGVQDDAYLENLINSIKSLLEVNGLKDTEKSLNYTTEMNYTFRKTELRLGNQINHISIHEGLDIDKTPIVEPSLVTVTSVELKTLEYQPAFSTMFQPIPIDTILLEKIGLKYNAKLGFMHESCQIYTVRKAENGYYIFNIIDNPVAIRQVEYLHQVQNFFTDIVGVDLIF